MNLFTASELQRWDETTAPPDMPQTDVSQTDISQTQASAICPSRARVSRTATPAGAFRPSHRYEVISELGGGAMSSVHLAHDTVTGRVVAVKCVADRARSLTEATERFAHEAHVVAQLRHPNVVETIAVEREGDTPIAIVTEYVRGASLREVLATDGALSVDRTIRVLRDVAAALAYTHARRIVHRDVKPANILIESDSGRALLADFGIACASGALPPLEAGGVTIGTPAYMSPEQVEGRPVDERADVYALCVVGWEMLAGQMPWIGEPLADVLHRQRYESLPDLALLRPDIPVFLLNAINGGLAKDPAQRWRDGAELLRQLSPTPTPLAAPVRTPDVALDATVRVPAWSTPAREQPPFAEPGARAASEHEPSPRRAPVLVSTIAAVVLLGLASLAPRLTRATERRTPPIDPELASMLTLAVAAPSAGTNASLAYASPVCAAGVTSEVMATPSQIAHCAPPTHRAATSHARRRAHRSRAPRRAR